MPELEAMIAEAREAVAAGRAPNLEGYEARLVAAARGGADGAEVERVRQALASIAAVHRARGRVTRELRPAPAPRPAAVLKTTPTITGTLDVRRADSEGYRLAWDADPKVIEWEVRFSERPDARSDYVEANSVVLPAGETAIDVPLGDLPFRVNVIGRGRGGRLQRRALVSGLTRAGWRSRWQRRASAS